MTEAVDFVQGASRLPPRQARALVYPDAAQSIEEVRFAIVRDLLEARAVGDEGILRSSDQYIRDLEVFDLVRAPSRGEATASVRVFRGVWAMLVALGALWGVLTGIAFSRDIWLLPSTGVYGLLLIFGLAGTLAHVSRGEQRRPGR